MAEIFQVGHFFYFSIKLDMIVRQCIINDIVYMQLYSWLTFGWKKRLSKVATQFDGFNSHWFENGVLVFVVTFFKQ